MKLNKKIGIGTIALILLILSLGLVMAVTYPTCCCNQGTGVYVINDRGQYRQCAAAGGPIIDGLANTLEDCQNTCGTTEQVCQNCLANPCDSAFYDDCNYNNNGGLCAEGQYCCSGSCTLSSDPGQGCGDPNLDIKPTSPSRVNQDKGYQQISLSWGDTFSCNAISYDILRCDASGCNPTTSIATTAQQTFVDTNVNWGATYTYKIKATYSTQGDKEGDTASFYSGDSTCEGLYVDANFCQNNSAYTCSDFNVLNIFESCSSAQICAAGNCISPSDCNPEEGNPFGSYNNVNTCEGTSLDYKYCFLDRSKTNVDKCYSCGGDTMACYDYKSRDSCVRDNCGVGTRQSPSSCSWVSVHDDLGVGVCVDTEADNCDLCKSTGSSGMYYINNEGYNDVYDIFSSAKLAALSTEKYPCFEAGDTCTSCGDVGCSIYQTISECSNLGSTAVNLDSTNQISTINSADSCGINVCRWMGGQCKKDADGIPIPDCSGETEAECEKDYFKPNSTVATIEDDEGVITGLTITISDQVRKGESATTKTGSSYITYYCIQGNSGHCRPRETGHGFTTTTSNRLSIGKVNDILKLCDGTCSSSSITLDRGLNTMKYYTQDPSINLGVIKEITFWASEEIRPDASAYIKDARKVNGVYYTNEMTPTIVVDYSIPSIIDSYRLEDEDGNVITLPYQGNSYKTTYIIVVPEELSDGTYTFTFNGVNEDSKRMADDEIMTFEVGTLDPTLIIAPDGSEVLETSEVIINLSFSQKVLIGGDEGRVYLNGDDVTSNFTTGDKEVYTATYTFPDGIYSIVVVDAENYHGIKVNGSSTFEVNAAEDLEIQLIKPTYGVSPTAIFDLEVETDNNAQCKLSLEPNAAFKDEMDPFDDTGQILHKEMNFNKLEDDENKLETLYVTCEDDYYKTLTTQGFEIMFDGSAPLFETHEANPSNVAELPPNTELNVKTDDITICTVVGEGINTFFPGYNNSPPGFAQSHVLDIYLPIDNTDKESKDYVYVVECMNQAEWNNSANIDVTVDVNADLEITKMMNEEFTNTTILLGIKTNLDTSCQFSKNSDMSNPINFDEPDVLRRTKEITVEESGEYTYYARCSDPREDRGRWGGLEPFPLAFSVDITPPEMLYVNDSSKLTNPDITWRTDRLRVSWLGEDNDTGVSSYYYRLSETGSSGEVIINWTRENDEDEWVYVDEDSEGDELNLTDGQKYQFDVKAKNTFGLIGEPLSSDGIIIDKTSMPEGCTNGLKDLDETDIDCGGSCSGCSYNQSCNNNLDCITPLYCNSSLSCDYPSCDDGQKNGDETGVDCGGNDCSECGNGNECNENSDCASNYCNQATGECSLPDKCSNNQLDSGETDIDCGGSCSGCGEGDFCDITSDCVSGLICVNGICSLDGDGDTILDSEDNCPGDANLDQADQDGDGKGDACDDDIDGDGLTNLFEELYNLDPYKEDSDSNGINDGEEDQEPDGLTNREEQDEGYNNCLDPWNKDSDGDKVSDKTEIEKGTDGCDANSKPKSLWWLFWLLLILLILILILYLTYPYYKDYVEKYIFVKKKETPRKLQPLGLPRTLPTQPQKQGVLPTPTKKENDFRQMLEKKRVERSKKRKGILSAFGGVELKKEAGEKETGEKVETKPVKKEDASIKKAEEKPNEKVKEWVPFSKLEKKEESKDDIFKKLKDIQKGQTKKLEGLQNKSNKEIFKKLEDVSKSKKIVPIIIKQAPKKKSIQVVSTKTGKVYHKKGCITVKTKKNLKNYKSVKEAQDTGLKKCNVCFPPVKKK